jgi:type IV secretory pathway VirB2 component (pilin)
VGKRRSDLMSVEIIGKAGIFTIVICIILAGITHLIGKNEFFAYSGVTVIIFLLMIDLFEREASRLGKKI